MKGILFLLLLPVSPALAQETRHLQGEVHSDVPVDLSWLAIRIEAPGSREAPEVAAVSVDGGFSFRGIPEGIYTLKVLDADGNEITSQPLIVMSTNPPIEVRLPAKKIARPTGESTSIVRLRHHPGKQALQHARQAQKFSEAGDYLHAAREYEKAVAADPEYSEAICNLGAQYVRLGRMEESVTLFQRAIALDPTTALHQSNLALALMKLGRQEEAEKWARHAVEIDNSNGMGHYILGCVLTFRTTTVAEAIKQLQTAARTVPRAHEVLAEVYRVAGNTRQANEEMREYAEAQSQAAGQPPAHWSSPLR